MTQEIFCKVENGKLVEYPLTALKIANRGERTENYTPVRFATKPAKIKPFHTLKEEATIYPTYVQVNYKQELMTLTSLLIRVHHPDGDLTRRNENVVIGDVSPAMLQAIVEAARVSVQRQLDLFALQRNYDDIKSACTYVGSAIPKFNTEAVRAVQIRDQTWASLYNYLEQVQTGALPVPKSEADVFAHIPAMTW